MCIVIKSSGNGVCGRLPPKPHMGCQISLSCVDTVYLAIGSFIIQVGPAKAVQWLSQIPA